MYESVDPAALRPRRRWYQYSLRSLLALTTLAAIGLSLLYARVERYRRQREAMEEHAACGAVFETRPGDWTWLRRGRGESEPVDAEGLTFRIGDPRPDHPALAHLPHLLQLKNLSLTKTHLTAKTLHDVEQLAELANQAAGRNRSAHMRRTFRA